MVLKGKDRVKETSQNLRIRLNTFVYDLLFFSWLKVCVSLIDWRTVFTIIRGKMLQ